MSAVADSPSAERAPRVWARGGFAPGPGGRRADWRVVAAAALLLLAGALYAEVRVGGQQWLLYVLGAALGLTLYHAAFGFASSWRSFVVGGRGDGLKAQMLMLAVASVIFLPILANGAVFGTAVVGAVAPVGLSVLVGAFLFGVGMQLGGGCASGTLYTVGGGFSHMVVTLTFFLVGSLLGSAHLPWWLGTPNIGSVSLLSELSLPGAIALQLALFAAIAGAIVLIDRRRAHGPRVDVPRAGEAVPRPPLWRRALQGPWPLAWGAVLLALLNAATLALAGHPWNISFGYALWAGKAAAALGVDVASWEFWTWPYPKRALEGSLFAEDTSIMNFGIVVGSFLAAGLAGLFAPKRRIGLNVALAAAIGGTLMGYGARIAFGCNIGALFSGIASGSLHGWLWFAAAFAGTFLGIALRPLFGLTVERPAR